MLSSRIVIVVTLSSQSLLSHLRGTAASAPTKRVPPSPENVPPLLQQYDFGGQLRTLEDSGTLPTDVRPRAAPHLARLAEQCRRTIVQNRMYR